jgi:pyruvate formate lyase activating enzyme
MPVEKAVTVLDIQRMSTEDGPGLRTTLFLKGCSLSCAWCHNPESINPNPVVQWSSHRCIACDSCRGTCESTALIHEAERIRVDYSRCSLCYSCVDQCPSGALHVKGELWNREELLQELLKDRVYFGDEGGITLSGGEPLLQTEAVLWLLEKIKDKGLNTALDTAGLVRLESLCAALEFTDLLLYDLKHFNSEVHRMHTGSGNETIFSNLVAIFEEARLSGTRIWIRTPLIPGVTDFPENIAGLAKWMANYDSGQIERWELCAFNNLCENKYRMLNLDWVYSGVPLLKKKELDYLVGIARENLGDRDILVQWTGSAALENEEGGDQSD